MKKLHTITVSFLLVSLSSFSQTDKEFWFVAPEVTNLHADRPIYLRMTTGALASTVTIAQPANAASFNGGSPIVINIPANTTFSQDLTPWIDQIESGNTAANTIENKGLYITATENITAYYEALGSQGVNVMNSDIFVLKGPSAIGTTFFTPFQNLLANGLNGKSSFDIVATENNTTVTITPSRDIIGHSAGVPFSIVLNKGQTYSAQASGLNGNDHLSGSKITADKDIAVTIKDDSANQGTAYDLIGDQLVPVNILGTSYIVVKGFLTTLDPNTGDRAVICATQNNTTVSIGGAMITTLNAGETYNYQVTLASEYIETSKPAYVFHVSGFGDETGGALLPPIVCTGSRSVSVFRDTDEAFYLNILVKNGGQGNFTIRNSATGVSAAIPSGSFSVVPGTPTAGDWYAARIEYNSTDFPGGSYSVVSNSSSDFHLGGINGAATGAGCRYGYFSDYATVRGGTATASSPSICYNSATTITLTGSSGTVQWQQSANGVNGWANVIGGSGATTTTYTTPSLTTDTYYRAMVSRGVCASATSVIASVNVDPTTVAGTVSADATVCSGGNGATLTLTGHVGSIVRWESSTNNFASKTNIANTTASQAYLNLTATTSYRAIVKSGVCSSGTSNDATVTVNPVSVGGTIASNATVCSGSNGATLTLSGYTGTIVRWEKSTDNFVSKTNIVNATASQAYLNLTATTKYRAIIKSGVCSSDNSSEATITVNPVSAGGTIASDATVCSGANGATLTLSSYTGTITGWEKSTDNFVSKTAITNTTATQTYLNLSATTKYRAIVKSGVCSSSNSSTATITVDAATVAGTLSGGTSVCTGANSGTITLSGQTGSIVRWEKSTDNFSTKTDISNTTASQTYTNITTSTKYRAIVQSGVCASAISPSATIAVDPTTVAGTLSGNTAVCVGNNSGTITLSGYVGTIKNWESSTNNFTSSTIIPNTANTYSYTFYNISTATKFRVNVQSGACAPAKTPIAAVAVNPLSKGGSTTTDTTVCVAGNSGKITLTGYTGTIQGWESSTNNFVNATPISATTASINFSNLNASTKYRAIVKSGACAATKSPIASIVVDPLSAGGKVNSDTTVCSISNAGALSLSGHTGSILYWMSSNNNFGTSAIINNTSAQQNFSNLSSTTQYKAVVKSGVCPSVEANLATVAVDPKTIGGEVSSNATICMEGNNGTLTLNNSVGTILNWESSNNNFNSKNTIANKLNTQKYLNLSESTMYRALVKSGVCPAEYSAPASLSIDPIYLLNLGPDSTICFSTGNKWAVTLPDTFSSILWSTGDTNTAITVQHAGVLTLNVSTKYGCKAEDQVVFEEYCVPNELCFPDVITPNNDGINDVFMPCFDDFIKITNDNYQGIVDNVEFINFEVFNRWGILMFSSENTLPNWDGSKNNSSAADGTYFWVVNYRDQIKHENHQQTGYLTVIGKNL